MLTKSKKLRTGRPVWEAYRTPSVSAQRLTHDSQADVLIVGTGVTGAMVGEALAAAGRKVILVDKRAPMTGATAASTALVQYEIDTPLIALSRKIGRKNAMRAWRRARLALDSLHARLRELGVDTTLRDTLYLAGNKLNARQLERESKALDLAGLENSFLTRATLAKRFGIKRAGALLSYGDIATDPRVMTATLLNSACNRGAKIYSPAEVVDIAQRKKFIAAITKDGKTIRCKNLVFATGYELPRGVPKKGHRITSTWAIATKRQKRAPWPGECFIWEASDPYLYMRTTKDRRVICGGEDEEFSDEKHRDALLERKTAILRRKLATLLPKIDTRLDFAWTASFGESDTGLPIIGKIPGMRNCWAALGYGGNGIVYARIAAEVLRAELAGEKDPDADLYAFRR